jgi:hypothetical protein
MHLLLQWFLVSVFALSCWGVGNCLRKALFPRSNSFPAPGRHGLSFAAGNVVFSYCLTALGFAGLLLPSILWATFLAGMGVAFWQVISCRTRLRGSLREKKKIPSGEDGPAGGQGPRGEPDFRGSISNEEANDQDPVLLRQEWLAFLLLAAVAGFFILPAVLQASAPPHMRDSLVYHLLCPKEYLKAGAIQYIGGNLYSAFPKGQEMLMTLLLAIGGDRAAQGFPIFQHSATAAGIFGLVRWMRGPWIAVLCAAGYATVPPAVYFSGCGYVDPALVMAILASLIGITLFLHFWPEASESENMKGGLFLGLLAGWMVAVKYTGLIYLGLIGLLLLWRIKKEPARKSLAAVGGVALGALPGFCWMLWNWRNLGNPVYPFGWFVFGGQDWDASRAGAMSLYFSFFGMGTQPQDYLMLPWRLAFSGRFDTVLFDGSLGPFLLLFLFLSLASMILSRRFPTSRRMPEGFGWAILASAAFFLFGTQQARFWLPTHLLICLYSAPALEGFAARMKSPMVRRAIFSFVLIFSLGWNAWFLGNQFFSVGYFRPVWGMETEKAFLTRGVPGFPALEFINSRLPESSRTFCVWTGAYGYYLNRPYYTDTFLEDFTLKKTIDSSSDGLDLCTRLEAMGFSHLYVRLSLLEKNLEGQQLEIFRDFLNKQVLEVFRHGDFAVFSLRCHAH